MDTDAYLTGIAFGAGTLCGFALIALIWRGTEYLISEIPYYLYKIKEWLK